MNGRAFRVSVVVPAFEAHQTVRETVESILAQSHRELEVIVVDDGSSRPLESLLGEIKDPRLRYVWKEHSGVSDTRNRGFASTQGDFVAFVDADDILSPRFVERRLALMTEHPDLGAACSTVCVIDESGRVQPGWSLNSVQRPEEIWEFSHAAVTCPSGYLFRRAVLEQHAIGFEPSLSSSADRLFLLDFLSVSTIGWVEDAPLLYRRTSESMSHALTPGLAHDREVFLRLVVERNAIPTHVLPAFRARQHYTLAAMYYRLGHLHRTAAHAVRGFWASPATMVALLTRKRVAASGSPVGGGNGV